MDRIGLEAHSDPSWKAVIDNRTAEVSGLGPQPRPEELGPADSKFRVDHYSGNALDELRARFDEIVDGELL